MYVVSCKISILFFSEKKISKTKFLSQTTYVLPREPTARSFIDGKAQISPDSMIGDSTRIGEKTSIKRSVVGKHCVIGKMVKMVGCVVLDHCVISDR
jgi:translation initiation factor eIF-2B subunit gamma